MTVAIIPAHRVFYYFTLTGRLEGYKQQGDTDQNKLKIALVTVVPAHQVFTLTGRLRGHKATR